MGSQGGRFVIEGRSIPFRPGSDTVVLGEIGATSSRLEVVLTNSPFGPLSCRCEVWEHTIHELETLSSSLRGAAGDEFPPRVEVHRAESQIGTSLSLRTAASVELGYSLQKPGAPRATLFCSSRNWGSRGGALGVLIGLAVAGGYGEAVVEPSHAIKLADWLDLKVAAIPG
jgi:hypothetical protein